MKVNSSSTSQTQFDLMKDALLYWEKFVFYLGDGIEMSLWQALLFEQARDAGRKALNKGLEDE